MEIAILSITRSICQMLRVEEAKKRGVEEALKNYNDSDVCVCNLRH